MYLICHVISKGHVIEGLCKFMGGSSLGYTTILTSFVTKGIRYNVFNLSHDLMWFHVLRAMYIYEWMPLTVSHHLAIFGGQWSSVSEDIKC